ncbi:hypothetical protein LSAT2_014140 [Lamellibrachia satsuma]|nr:hypothetical protein LSAT2_014140 [Lamellibrachia satsuma]
MGITLSAALHAVRSKSMTISWTAGNLSVATVETTRPLTTPCTIWLAGLKHTDINTLICVLRHESEITTEQAEITHLVEISDFGRGHWPSHQKRPSSTKAEFTKGRYHH